MIETYDDVHGVGAHKDKVKYVDEDKRGEYPGRQDGNDYFLKDFVTPELFDDLVESIVPEVTGLRKELEIVAKAFFVLFEQLPQKMREIHLHSEKALEYSGKMEKLPTKNLWN